MCDKAAVDTCLVFDSVPDWYTIQEFCYWVVSKKASVLKQCHGKCLTRKLSNEIAKNYYQKIIISCHLILFPTGLLRTWWLKNLIVLYCLMII